MCPLAVCGTTIASSWERLQYLPSVDALGGGLNQTWCYSPQGEGLSVNTKESFTLPHSIVRNSVIGFMPMITRHVWGEGRGHRGPSATMCTKYTWVRQKEVT